MQTNHPAEELDHHEKELGGQRVVEDARGTGDSGLHWTTRARAKQWSTAAQQGEANGARGSETR